MFSEDDVHRVDHAVNKRGLDACKHVSVEASESLLSCFVRCRRSPTPIANCVEYRSTQVFMAIVVVLHVAFLLLASIVLLQTPTMSFVCVYQSHGAR